jgi:cold shock CspA family protein
LGIIITSKEKYGFIYVKERNSNLFFHVSNVKDPDLLNVGDVCEFSIIFNTKTGFILFKF